MKPASPQQHNLIGLDGLPMAFVSSKNHILIDGADAEQTLQNARTTTGRIVDYRSTPGSSPRVNVTGQQLAERLHAVRRSLCRVNRSLRFPDEKQDLIIVAKAYHDACSLFFAEAIAGLQYLHPTEPTLNFFDSLAATFADVSFYAHRATPIAAPISAEACNLARSIVKQKQWFSQMEESKTKSKQPQVKNRFRQYDGESDLPHRKALNLVDGKLAAFDFYLTWSPPFTPVVLNNGGQCKRYWSGNLRRQSDLSKHPLESYDDIRIDKVSDDHLPVALTSLAELLFASAVKFELTDYGSVL